MGTVVIRGREFPLDPCDLDLMARLSVADGALRERIEDLAVGEGLDRERLEGLYGAVSAFFDEIFGEGALGVALDGRRNPVMAMEAYCDLRDGLRDGAARTVDELLQRMHLPERYDPDGVKV